VARAISAHRGGWKSRRCPPCPPRDRSAR